MYFSKMQMLTREKSKMVQCKKINSTYNRLVGWEFLAQVEHEQHEANKTKQLFAH